MRIISKPRLQSFGDAHSQAKTPLEDWPYIAKNAEWKNIDDVRKIYQNADPVQVKSGKTVTVFNIGGNKYRLITAIHYNAQKVFIFALMTHAEYSKNLWKNNY